MQPPQFNPMQSGSLEELMPSFCDKCGVKFAKADAEVVSTEQNKSVSKIHCRNCGNTFLMHVSSPVPGVASTIKTPFKSSLTTEEIKKFATSEKINPEEELDVYISLKDVRTIQDFNRIFEEKNTAV